MNNLRNSVGLVLLGSFIVACSTSAGGDPTTEGQAASEAAETSPPPAKTDGTAKKDDAKKVDPKKAAASGAPAAGQDGADGADGADDKDVPGLPNVGGDKFPGAGGDDGTETTTTQNGQIQTSGGHVASGHDCCFNGDYFECPDSNACFGGFDVNACIDACNGDFDCIIACTDKLSSAGAPKGCTQKAPPANVQCK